MYDDDGFKTVHIKKDVKKEITVGRASQKSSEGDLDENAPSLAVAREHYENALPRRVRDPNQPSGYRMCLPGELRSETGEPAELYQPFSADTEAIFEFGVGVSLYFKTLKVFVVTFLVCALVSLIAIQANLSNNPDNTETRLQGSAYGTTRADLKMGTQGISDVVVTLILMLICIAAGYAQQYGVEKIDKDHLTPSDYSVMVSNPPPTISDPDQYVI